MTRRALICIVILLTASCSPPRPKSQGQGGVRNPNAVSVCLLMCDGVSSEALERVMARGLMPNIRRAIYDRAFRVDNAIASMPSETYPNVTTMMTGLLPGHNGIAANIWVDRSLRRSERHTNIFRVYFTSDYFTEDAKTLFERIPGPTVAVTTPIFKGADIVKKNFTAVIASYFRNDWAFCDRKTLEDAGDGYRSSLENGELPPLVWAHLLGPDEVAHYESPESEDFAQHLATLDKAFGRLLRRLKRWGVLDRIAFVLVGDHGNQSYTQTADATELVHRVLVSYPMWADCHEGGCFLVPYSKSAKRPFDIGDTKVSVGAYRGVMIWLPGLRPQDPLPAAFKKARTKKSQGAPVPIPLPPRSGFAHALAMLPEIQLVVSRGVSPGSAEIYSETGRAEVLRDDSSDVTLYSYRVLEGQDPLGYTNRDECRGLVGGAHPASRWLEATQHAEYPDLAVQIAEYFDSSRAPDVYLTPKAGYGFRTARKAGHGALLRNEMVVPLLFSGPGIQPRRIPTARTVDVAPTILSYLGIPFDANEMDGEDLRIRTASGTGTPVLAPLGASLSFEGEEDP